MVLALLQCQKHRLLLTEPTKAKVVVHQQSAGKKKKKSQELSLARNSGPGRVARWLGITWTSSKEAQTE